jgi:cell volume regulation protein A
MTSHLHVDPYLLGGAVLLGIGVVLGGLARRLRVPGLLLFLGLGMLVGDDGLALVRFDDAQLAQTVAVIALVIILFEGGLAAPRRDLRRVLAPSALLATVGVVVTASVVALSAAWLFDLPGTTVWLMGAVVASTDAAATFSVLRGLPLPRRLAALLEVESGANDPMAALLTVGILQAWQGNSGVPNVVVFGVRQIAGGLAAGLVVGLVGVALLRAIPLPSASGVAVLATAFAGMAYGTAAVLGASGFLAVYVAGVVIGGRVPRHQVTIRSFDEGLANIAQIVLFFLLGLLVFPSDLPDVAGRALLVAVVLVLVARPLAVALCLPWFGFRRRELVLASWAGLRGAVPIVLATFPLTAGYPDGSLIFDVVFFVVLVSTAVQGVTVAPLAERLHLGSEPEAVGALAEIVPLETLAADVVQLELTPRSGLVGHTLAEAPPPDGARAAVLVRGAVSLVPDGQTQLEAGDVLVVAVPPGGSIDALVAWASASGASSCAVAEDG